jgi:hypothetical protein
MRRRHLEFRQVQQVVMVAVKEVEIEANALTRLVRHGHLVCAADCLKGLISLLSRLIGHLWHTLGGLVTVASPAAISVSIFLSLFLTILRVLCLVLPDGMIYVVVLFHSVLMLLLLILLLKRIDAIFEGLDSPHLAFCLCPLASIFIFRAHLLSGFPLACRRLIIFLFCVFVAFVFLILLIALVFMCGVGVGGVGGSV